MNDEQEALMRRTRKALEEAQEKIEARQAINNPSHYTYARVECIEIIEDLALPFHLGCAFKYLWRWNAKATPEENVRKAVWYLERWLELEES